jgi:hypothetical protein
VKNSLTRQEEAHCWTRRYEQLRQGIMSRGGLTATDGPGLCVMIRQGLIAWMRAWQDPLGCPAAALQIRSAADHYPDRVLATGGNPIAGQYGFRPFKTLIRPNS